MRAAKDRKDRKTFICRPQTYSTCIWGLRPSEGGLKGGTKVKFKHSAEDAELQNFRDAKL